MAHPNKKDGMYDQSIALLEFITYLKVDETMHNIFCEITH